MADRPLTDRERHVIAHALGAPCRDHTMFRSAEEFAGAVSGRLVFGSTGTPRRAAAGRVVVNAVEREAVARALIRHARDVATPAAEADRAAGLAPLMQAADLCTLTPSARARDRREYSTATSSG
jgi:hypothetical protein